MHRTVYRCLLLSSLIVTACASGGGTGGGTAPSDRYLISAERLSRTTAQNAYDVIRTLEPTWLESRGSTGLSGTAMPGSTATVFLDRSRAGDLEYLRQVPIQTISEIRYWPAREATAEFGAGHPRGVIQIITRR